MQLNTYLHHFIYVKHKKKKKIKPEEPCDVVDLVYDTSDRNVQYSIEWADIVLFCNFDKRGRQLETAGIQTIYFNRSRKTFVIHVFFYMLPTTLSKIITTFLICQKIGTNNFSKCDLTLF